MLQQAGIAVSRVDVQRPPVQFSDGDRAVLMLTNLGLVAVEFLKGELDADTISVTYTYGMNTGARPDRMMHAYDFAQPKGNKIGWMTSDTPVYFTMHHRWFIESWTGELDTAIKRALGQIVPLRRFGIRGSCPGFAP